MKNTGKEFVRNTCYDQISQSAQERREPQPPLEMPLPDGAIQITLPGMDEIYHPQMTLIHSIIQRKSLRRYSKDSLTLGELSLLLYTTQGIKEIKEGKHNKITFRTVPSGGARHAFETYLLINRVEGITPGLYRYSALNHTLVEVSTVPELAEQITQACLGQKQILNSAVSFIWVADVQRMTYRYVERGYRYLFLDAGHVCQNLSLVAEAVGCGVCAMAAYDDDALNKVLGVDGEDAFAIYIGALGKKE